MDQSKKTMRHFYCRDVLWETFEQMANDFDCSIDYLINEAMRFYVVRYCVEGRQHLAQERRGASAQRDVLYQGPRLDQRDRLQGDTHRQQAHARGRHLPHLRL